MKNGIKIYICTDKSSYILNFKLFPKDEETYNLSDIELTKIIKEVCNDIKTKNHILCVNNQFTSHTLSQFLKREKKWGIIGSLEKKSIPEEL